MNWGTRIALLYLSFVGLILALAFTCFGQNVELESKDYYAKELRFQDQLDATNNLNTLVGNLNYTVSPKSVELCFPAEVLTSDFKGSVNFFRPSDSKKDKVVELHPQSNGTQTIQDPGFIKGVYKMQISFTSNGKNYYKENTINFQ